MLTSLLFEGTGPRSDSLGYLLVNIWLTQVQDQWIAVAETQLELVDWMYVFFLNLSTMDVHRPALNREQLLEVLNLMSEPYKAALLARSKLGNPKFVNQFFKYFRWELGLNGTFRSDAL